MDSTRSTPRTQRGVKPNRMSLSAIDDPRDGIVCGTRQVKASYEGPRDTVPGLVQLVRGELRAGTPSAVHRELSAC